MARNSDVWLLKTNSSLQDEMYCFKGAKENSKFSLRGRILGKIGKVLKCGSKQLSPLDMCTKPFIILHPKGSVELFRFCMGPSPTHLACWPTYWSLCGARVLLLPQHSNSSRSLSGLPPPPQAANFSDEEVEEGFSLHSWWVVSCRWRRRWANWPSDRIGTLQEKKASSTMQRLVNGPAAWGGREGDGFVWHLWSCVGPFIWRTTIGFIPISSPHLLKGGKRVWSSRIAQKQLTSDKYYIHLHHLFYRVIGLTDNGKCVTVVY